jgi:hypothetical protein
VGYGPDSGYHLLREHPDYVTLGLELGGVALLVAAARRVRRS